MPVRCPVCETENHDDAVECETCGKSLFAVLEQIPEVQLIEGLEETVRDPLESVGGAAETMADLERTQLARRDLRVVEEVVPGVEHTQVDFDPEVASLWGGGVTLDDDRAADDGVRTLAPEVTDVCPWCGVQSEGAVCDSCGRRKARYSAPPAAVAQVRRRGDDDTVLCPACFAKVPPGVRCEECGVPFPVREL